VTIPSRRVSHRSSPGWRTDRGLALGDPESRIVSSYPKAVRRECGGYTVLMLAGTAATTAFYVVDGRIWAFGLFRPGVPLCR